MTRKGDCWDNAVAENLFHTLKVELIDGKTYNTRQEAKTAISVMMSMKKKNVA
jgi:putative transposase